MITINGNFNFFLKIINLTVEYINGLFDLTEGQIHLGKPFTVDHFSHFEVTSNSVNKTQIAKYP